MSRALNQTFIVQSHPILYCERTINYFMMQKGVKLLLMCTMGEFSVSLNERKADLYLCGSTFSSEISP